MRGVRAVEHGESLSVHVEVDVLRAGRGLVILLAVAGLVLALPGGPLVAQSSVLKQIARDSQRVQHPLLSVPVVFLVVIYKVFTAGLLHNLTSFAPRHLLTDIAGRVLLGEALSGAEVVTSLAAPVLVRLGSGSSSGRVIVPQSELTWNNEVVR